jgi:hypothetical protein
LDVTIEWELYIIVYKNTDTITVAIGSNKLSLKFNNLLQITALQASSIIKIKSSQTAVPQYCGIRFILLHVKHSKVRNN